MKETLGVNWGMHLLEIEITYRCNLNCLHCYNRYETNIDMSYQTISNLIQTASKHSVQKLVLTGGEACMHPDFYKISSFIKENRASLNQIKAFVLQTNGYAAEKCSKEELSAFDIVHISFDTNDNGVRVIDSDKQIQFAKKLKEWNIYSYFFVTINKNNLYNIQKIVDLANLNDIPIAFNFCTSNNKDENILLNQEDIKKVFKELIALQNKGKIRPLKHPYMAIYRQTYSDTYIGNRAGCTAGIASCVVKADGSVIPCPFLRINCGNIYDSSLEDIWYNSENFNKIRNRAMYDQCGSCKYVSYCGGCRKTAFEATGKLQGMDPDCIILPSKLKGEKI